MLDTRELVAAREDAEAILTSRGVRLTRARTSDGQGGRTNSYAPATSFDCRLEANARTPREETVGGAPRSTTRWLLMLPVDEASMFKAEDRVEVDGATVFHVTGVFGAESLALLGKLELELVEGAS